MCVTSGRATIWGTRTYVYSTNLDGNPRHVCGYQNEAVSQSGANCMFLNFAGSDLKTVRGPERTNTFMDDMTYRLPELVYVPRMRGGGGTFAPKGITVEDYGDYTLVIAQGPSDILGVLSQVPSNRRPVITPNL